MDIKKKSLNNYNLLAKFKQQLTTHAAERFLNLPGKIDSES